jgi:hypothetical protein
MSFIATIDLVSGLVQRITALQMSAPYAGPAFVRVAAFDSDRLADAIAKLYASADDRLCFVVPGGDRYEIQRLGNQSVAVRYTDVTLLIADREWTTAGQDATFGTAQQPGVLRLKDLVVDAIACKDGGISGALWEPLDGEMIEVTREGLDTPGRRAWVQNFSTYTGRVVGSPT